MKKFVVVAVLLVGATILGSGLAWAEGKTHFLWRHDRNILPYPPTISYKVPPAVTIDSGDTVVFATREGGGEQIFPPSATNKTVEEEVGKFDGNAVHPLSGPVYVKGAEPGDILQVDVIDIIPYAYAALWTVPSLGFLPKEFDKPYKHTFILDSTRDQYVDYGYGIRFQIDPMLGCAGVAPKPPFEIRTPEPGYWGGNMDERYFKRGSRWYFPVSAKGALFVTGDAHARQGDGEVSVTGMECPTTSTLKFTVIKGKSIPGPQFETSTMYATTGVGATMEEGGHKALRAMLDFLEWKFKIPRPEAYMLCSTVGNLAVAEVVDPKPQMRFELPKDIFVNGAPKMYGE